MEEFRKIRGDWGTWRTGDVENRRWESEDEGENELLRTSYQKGILSSTEPFDSSSFRSGQAWRRAYRRVARSSARNQ